MQVRKADGGNPMLPVQQSALGTTVEAEERDVASVQAHAKATRDLNAMSPNQRRQIARTARADSTAGQRSNVVQVEDQDGVVVREGMQTPSHTTTNLETTSPDEAIRRANSVKIRPGEGRTREDLLANLSPEEREQYLAELGAAKSAYADEEPIVARRVPAPGRQEREGIVANTTVGGGTEVADMGGTGLAGEAQQSVKSEEGITFTNTNGPKQAPVHGRPSGDNGTSSGVANEDLRRRLAKKMCSDFPDNYDFNAPERKKIARIQADLEDRPDVIMAIFSAESDAMKARLVEEFPEVLG
jgi:hypothetical protein